VRAIGRCAAAAVALPATMWAGAQEQQEPHRFSIGGSGAALGTLQATLQALTRLGLAVPSRVVSRLGSAGSLRAVEQGALDVALISRPLQVDERMRGLQAVEYGRTPFLLATSMPGVTGLTRAQLAGMIEDPRSTWPDGTPVRVVLRPKSDGDYALLSSMGPLVELALARAATRTGMVVAITDQEAVDAVARLHGGLGTSSLSLLRSGNLRLTELSLDNVAPTVANIENASYRIVNRMHIVTLGAPKGMAVDVIRYLQSADGLAMLAQLGHSTRVSH
jgi:phosphate transport system substrate-binding protein